MQFNLFEFWKMWDWICDFFECRVKVMSVPARI